MSSNKKNEQRGEQNQDEPQKPNLSLWQTFQSVLWAMLGVQKHSNAKRDFARGKASHFIVLGILFGIGFVIALILVVRLVLQHATT